MGAAEAEPWSGAALPSRRTALRRATDRLGAAGIAAPDARFLVLGLLGLTGRDLALAGDRPLDAAEAVSLDAALARRLSGEPVARILGAWEFWGLPFRLAPETLVPRPDTETVVAATLAQVPDRRAPLRILDLGTGSGCILTALLHELPRARAVGLDRSLPALRTARANAAANGVGARAAFAAGDWCDAVGGAFDLVVSNPPYVAADTIAGLDREVRDHDPTAALDGGPDGLDAYRRILDGVCGGGLIAPGGALVVEIGFDQAEAVRALGRAAGLSDPTLSRDLAGRDRVLSFGPGEAAQERGRSDIVKKSLLSSAGSGNHASKIANLPLGMTVIGSGPPPSSHRYRLIVRRSSAIGSLVCAGSCEGWPPSEPGHRSEFHTVAAVIGAGSEAA